MTQDTERTVNIIFAAVWRYSIRLLLLIVASIVAIKFGPHVLSRLGGIFASVLAAIFLTYALLPSVDWLARRRLRGIRPKTKRLLATTIVFIVFLGLIALCIKLFVNPFQVEVAQFYGKLADYQEWFDKSFRSANEWYNREVPAQIKDIVKKLDYAGLFSGVTESAQRVLKVVTSSAGIAVELLLIPVLAFYFTLDYKSLTREIYGLVPVKRRKEAIKIGRSTGEILQSYIFGQIILCIIAGVLTAGVLHGLGMPYVVVLALFAGITRAIPIIGPVVSGIPIVLVGVLYAEGNVAIPIVLVSFITLMHFAESKFIMPQLIGERLHLHPAVVIIVLLIGAEFMGLLGMFLAAPVAAIIRELFRLYYVKPRQCKRRQVAELVEPPSPVQTLTP